MRGYSCAAPVLAMLVCAALPGRAGAVVINASSNSALPSTITNYSVTGTQSTASTSIVEDVALSAASGPWHTNLINNITQGASPQPIFSGTYVGLTETYTNQGIETWAGWFEGVVTRTTFSNPNDATKYLFRDSTVSVAANYGSGFVTLTPNVDYTLTSTPYSGPPDSFNEEGSEAITIALIPSRWVDTGDTLRISKQIFDVFGDGAVWEAGAAAELAQYPTPIPEPAAIGAGGVVIAILGRRRRVH